jgi:hypothetical protein
MAEMAAVISVWLQHVIRQHILQGTLEPHCFQQPATHAMEAEIKIYFMRP